MWQVAGAGYKVKFTLNGDIGVQELAPCSGTWPNVAGHVSSACRSNGGSRNCESLRNICNIACAPR